MEEKEDEELLPILTPYEIYCFNSWVCLNIFFILYIIILVLPEDFISNYLGFKLLPQKYWFIAVPTHLLTTLFGLSICIKSFELINTIDDPPINDIFYHELSEEEMMKEIDYSPSEGILPDAGDINYDVVQKILNMDEEIDNNSDSDKGK